jgi:hypothetical protein
MFLDSKFVVQEWLSQMNENTLSEQGSTLDCGRYIRQAKIKKFSATHLSCARTPSSSHLVEMLTLVGTASLP